MSAGLENTEDLIADLEQALEKIGYTRHMKRTNLVLDEDLLERATRVLGVKTYSAAVNLALAETLRLKNIESLPQFFGKGLWQGDLSEMREDRPRARTQRSAKQGQKRR